MAERARVIVVGGGFGGLTCARRLEKLLPADQAEIVIFNPTNFMTFTPLLPEAAAGTLQPRHVGVPLRRVLKQTRVVLATAHLDHDPSTSRPGNLRALCQRCHMLHDRPEHRRRRRITWRSRRALGDLFQGPYRAW